MRRALAVVLVTLPLAAPATAQAPAYVFRGSGRISPGHGLQVAPQSIDLSGTVTSTSGDGSCTYSGYEVGATSHSSGEMNGGCAGGVGCAGGAYLRSGSAWVWLCGPGPAGLMSCEFHPHQTLPTTSYDLTCVGG